MTKNQIKKAAEKLAAQILAEIPEVTFQELSDRSNALEFQSDAQRTLELAAQILHARANKHREEFNKLMDDVSEIEKQERKLLTDPCVAAENMDPKFQYSSIDYWAECYRHNTNVIVCSAEDAGIDINARLGYVIY